MDVKMTAKKVKITNNDPNSEEDVSFVIENTTVRSIVLPPIGKKNMGQRMLPGENSVSANVWKQAEKNKAIKMFIHAGYLVNKGKGKARPILETLDGVSFQEAQRYVKKETDKSQMKRWAEGTETEHLKKMCEQKLGKMK